MHLDLKQRRVIIYLGLLVFFFCFRVQPTAAGCNSQSWHFANKLKHDSRQKQRKKRKTNMAADEVEWSWPDEQPASGKAMMASVSDASPQSETCSCKWVCVIPHSHPEWQIQNTFFVVLAILICEISVLRLDSQSGAQNSVIHKINQWLVRSYHVRRCCHVFLWRIQTNQSRI